MFELMLSYRLLSVVWISASYIHMNTALFLVSKHPNIISFDNFMYSGIAVLLCQFRCDEAIMSPNEIKIMRNHEGMFIEC